MKSTIYLVSTQLYFIFIIIYTRSSRGVVNINLAKWPRHILFIQIFKSRLFSFIVIENEQTYQFKCSLIDKIVITF